MGAQKWVIQRVKNSAGQVRARGSGSNGTLVKKSRVWSNAMITMISPRQMSSETMREEVVRNSGASERAGCGGVWVGIAVSGNSWTVRRQFGEKVSRYNETL